MLGDDPKPILLAEYRAPRFRVTRIELHFDLAEDAAEVTARTHFERTEATPADEPLRLDGRDIVPLSVSLDGRQLEPNEYQLTREQLVIPAMPASFELEVVTRLTPQHNTALEGLYKSQGKFCTHCEPEGFRRITYYLDRPDVMAEFVTTIVADQRKYPVLLSNGNLIDQGSLEDGRHFATWHDPFAKPSYLFALVAGDLVAVEDVFVTRSGRRVAIRLYVEEWNRDKCRHALQSVKQAMAWDEEAYGLEYDLDLFMVVGISDFNMGAMENKGLNIFNAKYILASPETATDQDFEMIRSVIGHEYFHNWTGNRVTCRDWFQLSLKEGLTVFREQQFTAAMGSETVTRLGGVAQLRSSQFPEDRSPMAHPVRPSSYIEIHNFYTATVYLKGAEIIRMLHTIIGTDAFRSSLALYLERHDGQAATIDDFLDAVTAVSGFETTEFRRWYDQVGTPEVTIRASYDEKAERLTLTFAQAGAGGLIGPEGPLVIPIRMGLLGQDGRELPFEINGKAHPASPREHVLLLTETEATYTFEGIPERPVPSLLRGFSAPVLIDADYERDDLRFLLVHDQDGYCRYEAGQELATLAILSGAQELADTPGDDRPLAFDPGVIDAFGELLDDTAIDPRFLALALDLPDMTYLMSLETDVGLDQLFASRKSFEQCFANAHRERLLALYEALGNTAPDDLSGDAIGRRELRNRCLAYLVSLDHESTRALAVEQYRRAGNMTERLGALQALVHLPSAARDELLEHFYRVWRDDPLVIDKWFAIQASSDHPDVLAHVKALVEHPAFDLFSPNRVYAIFRHFTIANPYGFHHISGEGYRIVADYVIAIDRKNPQVASIMVTPLSRYKQLDPTRRALMRTELERIGASARLSRDVFEVVQKSRQ